MCNEQKNFTRRRSRDYSSIVFVYSPSAHIPNAGLGHGCASTPANARPPHLLSFLIRLSSIIEATPFPNYFLPPTKK